MKNFAILDLILPRACAVCGRTLLRNERYLCPGCLADLPRTHFSKMRRNQMADRFNDLVQRSLDSGRPGYLYATALFFYRSSTGYRDITRSLKYHSNLGIGRYFSQMLGIEMAESELYSDVDTIVPVPLHWTRKWSRGYNQAEVIADGIARRLGAEVRTDVLWRPKRTHSQAKLTLEEKATNVSGAFRMKKDADLSGCKHILLVDDVFTTGATLCACYLAMSKELPPKSRISVAALACVGR